MVLHHHREVMSYRVHKQDHSDIHVIVVVTINVSIMVPDDLYATIIHVPLILLTMKIHAYVFGHTVSLNVIKSIQMMHHSQHLLQQHPPPPQGHHQQVTHHAKKLLQRQLLQSKREATKLNVKMHLLVVSLTLNVYQTIINYMMNKLNTFLLFILFVSPSLSCDKKAIGAQRQMTASLQCRV